MITTRSQVYLNLENAIYDGAGQYGIPEINPVYEYDAENWVGFNYCKTIKKRSDKGVHFFLDDYQFERVWNKPNTYVKLLREFSCVLSPDFSLYTNIPKVLQIYNHYRKHWLARYWQDKGITVIPTICWSDGESFEWCFDGEPKNSIVAVSNVGCMNNKDTIELFNRGYNKMLEILQPSLILFYAHTFAEYDGNVRYIRYMNGETEEVC